MSLNVVKLGEGDGEYRLSADCMFLLVVAHASKSLLIITISGHDK